MTVPSKAVFLSYASQDAEAAGRICEALRAAGIEVWFDQSELRGGDAWDQKIRREIRECALFIPIISTNTQERTEGYFRLEWRLADQRTHLMGKSRAFLVPVCIDDTRDADADVPESFAAVQWTRLPGGNTPPAFTARVVTLLGAPVVAGGSTSVPVTPLRAMHTAPAKPTPHLRLAAIGAATLVVIGLAYVVFERFEIPKQTAADRHVAAAVPAPAVPAIPEKSVAVLPFVDMSEKHDEEYFSDGLSEELIDMLTKVPDLRVPARTSSFSFKGKSEDIPTIAKRLLVAHVLEGSVRRSGNHLRVTAQLVRADNGYHLWSETYDRTLDDIFKVQDDIANAVVTALKVALVQGSIARPAPTANTDAYILYLQAREIWFRGVSSEYGLVVNYLNQALQLDPNLALAWAQLSRVRTGEFQMQSNASFQEVRAESLQAAQQALKINPMLPEAHLAMAAIYYDIDFDWDAADRELSKARELGPSADYLNVAILLAAIRGALDQAMLLAKTRVEHDPVNAMSYMSLGVVYFSSGKFSEAEAAYRKALELKPTIGSLHCNIGQALLAQGNPTAALAEIEKETDEDWRRANLPLAHDALGRKSEANAELAVLEANYSSTWAYQIAAIYSGRRDLDRAFAWLDRAYLQRDDGLLWIKTDWLMRNLHDDPRWNIFLRKMKLPE